MKAKQKTKTKSPSSPFTKGKKNTHVNIGKRKVILGLIVGVFGILLYSNTLSYDYVLDDFSAIKENNIVRQGIHAIPEIFHTSYRQGYLSIKDGLYRPLSLATFAIEWNYFPDKPAVSHLVNVLLYGITGGLLFFFMCYLTRYFNPREEEQRAEVVAFIASLLFIAHPLHVEVVANIKSRDEILCFLFMICSFLFIFRFLENGFKKFLFFGLAAYFLSLLSKETSITFLLLLPLAIHFFSSASIKKNISVTAFFFGTALVYLFIRYSVLQGAMTDNEVSIADNVVAGAKTFGTHIGTSFYILGLYVLKLIFPHPLSYDYSFKYLSVVPVWDFFAMASIIFYVAIGGHAAFLLFKSFRQKSKEEEKEIRVRRQETDVISFGILFFLITIFLFSNLALLIGTSMGDRLMYFPSFGFCIVLAILLVKFLKIKLVDFRHTSSTIRLLPIAIIILLFGYKTYSRNADWKNNYTLYAHDVKIVPYSVKAHYYLGLELVKVIANAEQNPEKKKRLYEDGIRELEKTLDLLPTFSSAYTQIGVAYYRMKNYEKAIENYHKAAELMPADAITLNNVGSVYFEWGKYTEAAENFRNALRMDPRFVDAYMNLGSVYGTLKDYNNAITNFQYAIKYAPDNARAYYYIGITYQNKGDKENADKYYRIAERINPEFKRQ